MNISIISSDGLLYSPSVSLYGIIFSLQFNPLIICIKLWASFRESLISFIRTYSNIIFLRFLFINGLTATINSAIFQVLLIGIIFFLISSDGAFKEIASLYFLFSPINCMILGITPAVEIVILLDASPYQR